MEFLYAGVFNVDKLEDLAQFAALKQLAKQLNLKELSTNLKNIKVLLLTPTKIVWKKHLHYQNQLRVF